MNSFRYTFQHFFRHLIGNFTVVIRKDKATTWTCLCDRIFNYRFSVLRSPAAHFNTIEIFGAKLGVFSRNDQLSTEDFEMLVVAEK